MATFFFRYLKKKKMIKFALAIVLFAYATIGSAQKLFSVDYESQADINVFVVQYESQADLKVYKVKYESQATGNDGKWFFTQYASQANKKVFFVKYESQADLKIYFVDYESQSGWRNKSKITLLY